ncbi:MAG: maltodextrin glucosidase [Atopobiaceae bacterium]|nr:maltodextrin glucosidase [Atopobiaceae bacterium]
MAWYDEAVFYHIYPLGLTGAPKQNDYGEPVHRLNTLLPWIEHIRRLGFTALYIGPLFQSVGHGYETTDYRTLDTRLGTNEDLKAFVCACHDAGIRVVFDGVFNHTGRDFFAFRDLREHREQSAYRDWYCNVNFWGNNEYNDGFSYDNWGGYDLLAKLNQRNPVVRDYLCDVVRFWVSEFDVDGIRLDAADVLDFEFMKALRQTADAAKPDFWLMGEVIHGDYSRWANERTLHSVTDYALHKGLYSGHNDHNYFEIAHTVRRTQGMIPAHIKLYNFVDNHDVERISTKLRNKAYYLPVHVLLYTLPGIPSVYYGSEFGIEGKKERFSDDSLRPCIDLAEHAADYEANPCTELIGALGSIRKSFSADLAWGDYNELCLTTEQFSFARGRLIVAVNNAEREATLEVKADATTYVGLLSGEQYETEDGRLSIVLPPCGGEIFAPEGAEHEVPEALDLAKAFAATAREAAKEATSTFQPVEVPSIPYEEMSVEQLQSAILEKMAKNGPVTDQMRHDVEQNIWPDSLINWAKSFR